MARSYWQVLLLIAGIVVVLAGSAYDLYYVNLPYQDPPPELAARQAHHELVAERIYLVGFVMTAIGSVSVVWVRVRRHWRRWRGATGG